VTSKAQPYEELLTPWLTGSPNGDGEAKGYCPVHEDPATSNSPSASFNFKKKVVNCHGQCGQGYSFTKIKRMLDTGELPEPTPSKETNNGDFFNPERKPKPLPSEDDLVRWHGAVWSHVQFLYDRGLNQDILRQFKIGWNGERYTIPVYDQGKLVNVRLYKPNAPPNEKMWNWRGHGSPVRLYPGAPAANDAVLCEGEWDALLLRQHGLPAVTATHGAGTWAPELSAQLAGKRVYVAYDCDDAGRAGATTVAESLVQRAREVHVVDLGLDEGEDVTDWFVITRAGKWCDS
jgi:Toprim-like